MVNRLSFLIFFSSIFFIASEKAQSQWVQMMKLDGARFQCFAVNGTTLFAGTDYYGIFRSTDNGTTWTPVDSGLTDLHIGSLAVSGTNIFAGTWGGVFLSTNNGPSWMAVNSGLINAGTSALAVSGTDLFAATGGGVFRSTNNGGSWMPMNSGLPTYYMVTALVASGVDLFAGTNGSGVFFSNNGASWVAARSGLTSPYVAALAAMPGMNVFVGLSRGGVFLSTNNGTSWIPLYGLPASTVFTVAVNGMNLFASTNGGAYLSTNNGSGWMEINSGFPSPTFVLAFAVSGTYVFAGTSAGGVWRRPLSEIITSVEKLPGEQLPRDFVLNQNYPNPFNPSTTISFSIPASGHTTLTIYDVLGNEVATLVSENLAAGEYRAQWDGSHVPSGVYFYRLRSGRFVQTQKLLLVR